MRHGGVGTVERRSHQRAMTSRAVRPRVDRSRCRPRDSLKHVRHLVGVIQHRGATLRFRGAVVERRFAVAWGAPRTPASGRPAQPSFRRNGSRLDVGPELDDPPMRRKARLVARSGRSLRAAADRRDAHGVRRPDIPLCGTDGGWRLAHWSAARRRGDCGGRPHREQSGVTAVRLPSWA